MKSFFKRHSWIVLLIVAMVIAGTNYLVYPVFIKKELGLVQIPVAKEVIGESTLITDDMLTTISVAKEYLPINIETEKENIVGKYSDKNVTIAQNGFIYKDLLTDEVQLYGETFHLLENGEWAYTIAVDAKYNQNNALKEGEYVSIYYLTEYINEYETEQPLFGQLAENVRIIAINDVNAESKYVTLAIPENDIAYYSLAEKTGEIFPLINYASSKINDELTKVYDIGSTRQYIQSQAELLNAHSEQNTNENNIMPESVSIIE